MNQSATRHHVYLSSTFWDDLWIIQQPICNEISRSEPVLFVERMVSLFTVLRYPKLWPALFRWTKGPRELRPGLHVLASLPLFHAGHRVPWLFRLDLALQRLWIRWWARRLPGRRVLWLDNPVFESCVGRLSETLAVYHLADEMTAFPTSDRQILERMEQSLLPRIDVLFTAADSLTIAKQAEQPRSFTIWNAIDAELFAQQHLAEPDQLRGIPEPRVAFVGVIDEWVDTRLLRDTADALPHVHFIVAGPVIRASVDLEACPNVHLIGRIPRSQVPALLRACGASLVPFHRQSLTERIVPLKIFEALAAGIVPVCTDFSMDLQRMADAGLLLLAHDSQSFVRAVEAALEQDTPSRRLRLATEGRTHTWAARWEQMRGVLATIEQSREPRYLLRTPGDPVSSPLPARGEQYVGRPDA